MSYASNLHYKIKFKLLIYSSCIYITYPGEKEHLTYQSITAGFSFSEWE